MTGARVATTGAAVGGGSTTASVLAEAVALVERAIDGLRAAREVEWESHAAGLYRADALAALHGALRDREVLDGVVRQAAAGPVP